jgi:glutathione synthase/RimK-type ligase-like ATP-grasp enzyme
MGLPYSRNKWLKYRFMKSSSTLKSHIPRTYRLTRSACWSLIDKYKRIIIKPIGGKRGQGVIQVTKLKNRRYEIHMENRKFRLIGYRYTYKYLKKITGNRGYMVQRWIHRAKINYRPFDMRVIVQRRKNSSHWEVTGEVAKVAGKGYIVSNIERSRGTVLQVSTAIMKSNIKKRSVSKLQRKLDKVAVLSAKRLSRIFPHQRIYGLDMALNRKGRVWVIEANLYPAMSHFQKLQDKTMLRRIMAYKRGEA